MKRISFLAILLALSFGIPALAQQDAGSSQETKVVRKASVSPTVPDTGKGLYDEYCAVCHGKLGKGDGPAASAFKAPPADLTVLARQNGGKFPADHVAAVLRFGSPTPAHGSSEMPVWGGVLGTSPIHGTEPVKVQQRILGLINYMQTLQAK